MNTFKERLRHLGVGETTLRDTEKNQINQLGYLILDKVFTDEQVLSCLNKIAELSHTFPPKGNTHHISHLSYKDPLFPNCWMHPKILASAYEVIQGDFILGSDKYRAPLPGGGSQGMHCDFSKVVTTPPFPACSVIIPLVDFTPMNGATRLIPGSHLSGKAPPKEDHKKQFSREILLLGKAGSALIFNGQAWHSGTLNRSDGIRHSLHLSFMHKEVLYFSKESQQLLPPWIDSNATWLFELSQLS